MKEKYYEAYEMRYKAAYKAGAENWGHSADNEVLVNTLKKWVEKNNLKGKKIIEFACGEGASGIILSELGCIYHGVDISPTAIEKTKKNLEKYPNADCEVLDMVNGRVNEKYDAALDCMGLHMIITDGDRKSYLENAYKAIKEGSPMLLFRESYRKNGAFKGEVKSFDEWVKLTGDDYNTPQLRKVKNAESGEYVDVYIPLLPARAKDKEDYIKEFENIGFKVEKFVEMDVSTEIAYSATIYIRKEK